MGSRLHRPLLPGQKCEIILVVDKHPHTPQFMKMTHQAGQIALSPQHMIITTSDVTLQLVQVLNNIEAVLNVYRQRWENIFYLCVYMIRELEVKMVDEMLRGRGIDDVIIQYIGVTTLPRGAAIEVQSTASELRREKRKKGM